MSLQVDQTAVPSVSIMNLKQDTMAVDTSSFAIGRCWLVGILLVGTLTIKAQNVTIGHSLIGKLSLSAEVFSNVSTE